MTDTIVALATPNGESALSLIRVSGEKALEIANQACDLKSPTPRHSYLTKYSSLENETLDQVICVFYENGKSFTSEDTIEIICHGNPILVKEIVNDLLARRCRMANPGEFSYRSYINGKIDLTQAEAIAEIIAAKSKLSLSLASKNLDGNLTQKIAELQNEILNQQSFIEAFIDFPEDDLGDVKTTEIIKSLNLVISDIEALIKTADRIQAFNRNLKVVIVGPPNAGKSTIFNCIVGKDRAIVDQNPGTTRDYVNQVIEIGNTYVDLIDTAGIHQTDESIEKEGIKKSITLLKEADLVLIVFDGSLPYPIEFDDHIDDVLYEKKVVLVQNKADLPLKLNINTSSLSKLPKISTSKDDSVTIDNLLKTIEEILLHDLEKTNEFCMSVNLRQSNALKSSLVSLGKCMHNLAINADLELCIPDLKDSINYLAEIAGSKDNEEMLDLLFSNFCIGK
ncbi:MAG: tRNA uridine-5-carboxymethylaminomethyl(34) synthesis GTPase MnmE [Verrucomicrobiota bacterium]|nr:tRNA uridine-5-carboxymethylaminomethyl(34) synthesis GTPase MnmE [Verrucomicrobiota bacterium]